MRFLVPLYIAMAWGAHVYILHEYALLNWTMAITDSSISVGILSLAAWGILLIVNAYPTNVGRTVYGIVIATAIGTAAHFLQWLSLRLYGSDEVTYLIWLSATLPVRFIVTWLLCAWLGTYHALKKRTDALEEKFQKHTDASTLLREAELYKLRQQLQPHFLYNSLNSISALVITQPDKAQEMVGRLSDFLRSSVKREAQDNIAIAEEISYVEAYLAIETTRFGDRLNVAFEQAYTDDATIPPFLLQPLLENAIKFGLYGKTGKVFISMKIELVAGFLVITVTNPYDPDNSPPKGTGFGLKGIERRLYLLYARTDLLETSKDDINFTTILKIPQAHAQSNTDR